MLLNKCFIKIRKTAGDITQREIACLACVKSQATTPNTANNKTKQNEAGKQLHTLEYNQKSLPRAYPAQGLQGNWKLT